VPCCIDPACQAKKGTKKQLNVGKAAGLDDYIYEDDAGDDYGGYWPCCTVVYCLYCYRCVLYWPCYTVLACCSQRDSSESSAWLPAMLVMALIFKGGWPFMPHQMFCRPASHTGLCRDHFLSLPHSVVVHSCCQSIGLGLSLDFV
jgi:hypothetical protein